MLEKARIHRAMLRLAEIGPFSVSGLVRETAAAPVTVRKNIERDCRAGYLEKKPERRPHGGQAGAPEKLYCLTQRGRVLIEAEIQNAYATLRSLPEPPTEEGVEEPAALTAARETLADLDALDVSREEFGARLRIALAELAAAADAGTSGSRNDTMQIDELRKVSIAAMRAFEKLPAAALGGDAAFSELRRQTSLGLAQRAPAVMPRVLGDEPRRAALVARQRAINQLFASGLRSIKSVVLQLSRANNLPEEGKNWLNNFVGGGPGSRYMNLWIHIPLLWFGESDRPNPNRIMNLHNTAVPVINR